MSARHKLNSANMSFCVMMAGLVGLLMGSWGWFAPAAVACVAGTIHSGGIRLRPTAPAAPLTVRTRADPRRARARPEGWALM